MKAARLQAESIRKTALHEALTVLKTARLNVSTPTHHAELLKAARLQAESIVKSARLEANSMLHAARLSALVRARALSTHEASGSALHHHAGHAGKA
jgi:hypothetical protein